MSNHTICGLSQSGLNGRQPRRTPVLKANHKKHEWNLPFSHFLQCHISSDAKMKLTKKMTQRLLWNMEEARLCSCFALVHLAQRVLKSQEYQGILEWNVVSKRHPSNHRQLKQFSPEEHRQVQTSHWGLQNSLHYNDRLRRLCSKVIKRTIFVQNNFIFYSFCWTTIQKQCLVFMSQFSVNVYCQFKVSFFLFNWRVHICVFDDTEKWFFLCSLYYSSSSVSQILSPSISAVTVFYESLCQAFRAAIFVSTQTRSNHTAIINNINSFKNTKCSNI